MTRTGVKNWPAGRLSLRHWREDSADHHKIDPTHQRSERWNEAIKDREQSEANWTKSPSRADAECHRTFRFRADKCDFNLDCKSDIEKSEEETDPISAISAVSFGLQLGLAELIITVVIALRRKSRFVQSPHCSANCLQHVCSSGQGAIMCKSRASSLTEFKSHLFELYLIGRNR